MNPLFILMLALSSVFSLNSNAADVISAKALKSFETTFINAKEVTWIVIDNRYKVQFLLNDQTISAFYNEEGKLIALTRNISSLQLPIILQTELKNEYRKYWITELFEMSNDNGAEYYITLEDADNKTILKSSIGSGTWEVYQKLRKS
jgi:hypothetical protein